MSRSKSAAPSRLATTARVKNPAHEKLRHAAKLYHTKPGVLASWLLEVGANGKIDQRLASLQALQVTVNDLNKLTLRMLSWWRALNKEVIDSPPGSPQYQRAAKLLWALQPLLESTLTGIDLCQGVAAGLIPELPPELRADAEAAKRCLPLVLAPKATDSDAQQIAHYLMALRILP